MLDQRQEVAKRGKIDRKNKEVESIGKEEKCWTLKRKREEKKRKGEAEEIEDMKGDNTMNSQKNREQLEDRCEVDRWTWKEK